MSRKTVAGTAIVSHVALLSPNFLAAVTAHGAQCCDLSLAEVDSVIADYWAVFLYRQTPAGALVADHSVMLSRQASMVSAVNVVKIFVI